MVILWILVGFALLSFSGLCIAGIVVSFEYVSVLAKTGRAMDVSAHMMQSAASNIDPFNMVNVPRA